MNMKRGFVTVATGKYYCRLAENLVMSYKLYSNSEYPFYVITDRESEKRLKKYFDGVIVMDKPNYNFLDKMYIYNNTVFDETVFIDADANIVSDISYLFDEFEKNGSEISCIGALRDITEQTKPNHFGSKMVEKYSLKQFVAFNGGVYYFKKTQKAEKCLDYIFSELIPNYFEYGLKEFRNGQMADEPLFGLAMLVHGFKPLDIDLDVMKLVQRIENLVWNMSNKTCWFVWYGYNVSPAILHYGTHNTYSRKYVKYNSLVRKQYKKIPGIFYPFELVKDEIILFFRIISDKSRRKNFNDWFFAHFSVNYLKNLISKK